MKIVTYLSSHRNWVQGLQREGHYCGSHEFKLSGNPWWATGEETVESRYLVGVLLAKLKEAGWEVGATLDVARKMQDKTVFIMRQCPPLRQDWAVIGFHETDKVINAFSMCSQNMVFRSA